MSYVTVERFKELAATGKIFFNAAGEPVQPVVGQWFCEFELTIPEDSEFPEYVQDEALVRFEGYDNLTGGTGDVLRVAPMFWDESADEYREPRTQVLILQA